MGARLLAAIERSRKAPWIILALLIGSTVGALAQFAGAAKSLVALVHRPQADPHGELAKLASASLRPQWRKPLLPIRRCRP